MINMRFKCKCISLLFAFVFASFATSLLYGAGPPDVTVEVVSSGLVVTNNTTRDVYYEVHEQTLLARIEWAPICKDENRILPKKSVRVITTFEPSGKLHVFWWHKGKYLTDYHQYGPDQVRSFVIQKR